MSVVVIANPTKLDDLDDARARLRRETDRLGAGEAEWVLTTVDDHGTGQAQAAADRGARLVLAWGGDGTVNAVAAGLADSGVSLGILPGGTGNLLARNLRIPLGFAAAVRTAYQGRDRRIDLLDVSLGRGEHRVSLVMCGTGWDAAMMDVPAEHKARFGWAAYVVQAARTMRERPQRMRIKVDDGETLTYYGRTCLIANVGTLVGGLELLPESKPDDGRLEVMVFDPTSPREWAQTTWGVLRGHPAAHDPARTVLTGRRVVVTTHRPLPRQIDGDLVHPGHGFVARVRPLALTVRVP